MFEINIGNIDIGKRRILNRDNDTKAVLAVSWLFSSTRTKVANVTKATCSTRAKRVRGEKERRNHRVNDKFIE